MSKSWQPYELEHTRLLCPPLSPGVCSNSCPFSQWSYLTISSSTTHFSFCLHSFPASESFPIRWLFALGGQNWSFSNNPSSEYSWLISFRIDWFDILAIQGTLSSLLHHHSSKALVLWHSAFFTVHPSQPYVTTGNTIALTKWTFVGRVMSLLFNTLSRFVIAFLLRSNCLLISWMQSASAVILEPKKRKFVTASTFSPSICHEVMGLDAMILVFLILIFKHILLIYPSTSPFPFGNNAFVFYVWEFIL